MKTFKTVLSLTCKVFALVACVLAAVSGSSDTTCAVVATLANDDDAPARKK